MQRTLDRNQGLCTPCHQKKEVEDAALRLRERQRTLVPIREEDWLRASPNGSLTDEANALRACLALLEIGSQEVFEAATTIGPIGKRTAAELERTAYYLQSHLPTLAAETICDFIGKNRRSYPTDELLSPAEEFTVISDNAIREIFRDENGWDRFRIAYPDAAGIATVARVGLNVDDTQALVCAGVQGGGLMGRGDYCVLEKRGAGWLLTESRMAWIS